MAQSRARTSRESEFDHFNRVRHSPPTNDHLQQRFTDMYHEMNLLSAQLETTLAVSSDINQRRHRPHLRGGKNLPNSAKSSARSASVPGVPRAKLNWKMAHDLRDTAIQHSETKQIDSSAVRGLQSTLTQQYVDAKQVSSILKPGLPASAFSPTTPVSFDQQPGTSNIPFTSSPNQLYKDSIPYPGRNSGERSRVSEDEPPSLTSIDSLQSIISSDIFSLPPELNNLLDRFNALTLPAPEKSTTAPAILPAQKLSATVEGFVKNGFAGFAMSRSFSQPTNAGSISGIKRRTSDEENIFQAVSVKVAGFTENEEFWDSDTFQPVPPVPAQFYNEKPALKVSIPQRGDYWEGMGTVVPQSAKLASAASTAARLRPRAHSALTASSSRVDMDNWRATPQKIHHAPLSEGMFQSPGGYSESSSPRAPTLSVKLERSTSKSSSYAESLLQNHDRESFAASTHSHQSGSTISLLSTISETPEATSTIRKSTPPKGVRYGLIKHTTKCQLKESTASKSFFKKSTAVWTEYVLSGTNGVMILYSPSQLKYSESLEGKSGPFVYRTDTEGFPSVQVNHLEFCRGMVDYGVPEAVMKITRGVTKAKVGEVEGGRIAVTVSGEILLDKSVNGSGHGEMHIEAWVFEVDSWVSGSDWVDWIKSFI